MNLVIDRLDPRRRDRVVMATRVAIGFGQQDAVAAHMVDGADMLAIRTEHLLMLLRGPQRIALALASLAPGREFALEARLVLAAIFVIIAVERADLLVAPVAIT